jgi:predicted TIM-barrel fold metal-dependent hydrolase
MEEVLSSPTMSVSPSKRVVDQLLAGSPLVDADTHITEWYDLWTSRAPAKFKDRVPQVIDQNGHWEWIFDGKSMGRNGASSCIARSGEKILGMDFQKMQLADVHPSAYDVKERLKFMDSEGIAAQIGYPNLMGFGGQASMKADKELRDACVLIFNDAMAEMQADSNNRIYPMAMMPWWDIDFCVREATRCADMGFRGINMNSDPNDHGFPTLGNDAWSPLWEVCIDRKLPVNFHIGASDETMSWFGHGLWPEFGPNIKLAYGSLTLFIGNMRVLANIIFSGMLERHEKLKIVSVESGAGWLPFFLEGLEYQMDQAGLKPDMTPSEIFQRQIYVCSWFERREIVETARSIGVDNLMYETDFPHPTCLYPDSQDYMADAMRRFTPEERRKVFGGNAERLYNLDLSAWRKTLA